jgi:hypothetical protein
VVWQSGSNELFVDRVQLIGSVVIGLNLLYH